MEAQLRRRIEALLAITNNSIRNIEHRTFRRLLYRNRNQHRHGFYFRKLEHVRRLVIRIDSHIAWESLQYSLGDSESGKSRTNIPLSISSLTVNDLDHVEKQLDQLVSAVIIDAARKVMTDLVCREHFLPFAVSVLASLARLFVIERKVLSEVRGIRTEMNLLFATECNPGPPQEIATARTQAANEDLGFEMNVQNKPKPDALSKTRQTGSLGNRADSPKHVSTVTSIVKPSSGDDVPLPTATALEAREPSLYQAVAKHVDTTKFSVQIRNRISVSLPQVLGNTHGKNSEKNSDNPRLDSASATKAIATKDEITVSNTVSKATERRAVGSSLAVDDDMRKQRKFSQEYENGGLSAKASADASDSDDIDDIFDVLEDT